MASVTTRTVRNHGSTSTWLLTSADPVGDEIVGAYGADKSIQVRGTLGGATVIVEGSNLESPDPSAGSADWQVMHDEIGNELLFTAEGKHAISEVCEHMRVRLSGGAGASVTVALYALRGF